MNLCLKYRWLEKQCKGRYKAFGKICKQKFNKFIL